jgi:L-threonylcarbamoyladenylate synthase
VTAPEWLACAPADARAASLSRAAQILRSGKLVAFPTETVYGLGALALSPAAVRRVFEAKGRPSSHPLIVHVTNLEEARRVAAGWTDAAEALASAFWPGPLTLVLQRQPVVPPEIAGGRDSVAVRAPAHPIAIELLREVGEPLAAPSANRFQHVSPTDAVHVARSLGARVDAILDGGPTSWGLESTVVDVRSAEPVLLRPGALPWSEIACVVPSARAPASIDVKSNDARPSPGLDKVHYAPSAPLWISDRLAQDVVRAHRLGQVTVIARAADCGESTRCQVADALRSAGDATAHAVASAIRWIVLPDDAVGYGRGLYRALHEGDDDGSGVIVVARVPETDPWMAVNDRLRRAAARSEPGA